MKPHLVLSCSLREESRSAILARELAGALGALERPVQEVDLRRMELPFCDDGGCYRHPEVVELRTAIEDAATVTIATPIYNFEVGGATRNLVALTGRTWSDKIVGLVCAAGGRASYMSVMTLANSLMLDFRCLVIPRFVYATRNDFDDGRLTDERVASRVSDLAGELDRLSSALVASI